MIFLAIGLVHRQERALRPGAGVLLPDQVEEGGEVHLHRVVAGVRLDEVEDRDRRRCARTRGQRLRPAVDRRTSTARGRGSRSASVMASMSVFFFRFFFPFSAAAASMFAPGYSSYPSNVLYRIVDLHRAGLRCRSRFFPVRNVMASVVM